MRRLLLLCVALGLTSVPALAQQPPVQIYAQESGTIRAVTVDSSGRLSIVCSNCTGTGASAVDDATFTVATDSVAPAGYLFDDVAPDSVNENDIGVGRMSANRNAYVTIRDAAGNERGLAVDANGAIAVTGSFAVGLADDADFTAGTTTFSPIGGFYQSSVTACTDGDTCAAGLTAQRTLKATLFSAAGAELSLASDKAEDAAHTTADTGPVVLTRRIDTAASSAGTSGDYATLDTDSLGRLWTRNGNPCADHARITTAAISTASSGNVEIVALNGSDLIYICGYSVVATAATAVQFIRGTGTACATGETDLTGPWSFAANGGITQANAGVPQFVVAAGNAFCIENSGANAIEGHVTYVRTASP